MSARRGGLGGDFSLASEPAARVEGFTLPEEPAIEQSATEKSEAALAKRSRRRAGATGAALLRSRSGTDSRLDRQGSRAETDVPSFFRRRSEPLPGTYGPDGRLGAVDPLRAGEQRTDLLTPVREALESRAVLQGNGEEMAGPARLVDAAPAEEVSPNRTRQEFPVAGESGRKSRLAERQRLGSFIRMAGEPRDLTPNDEAVVRGLKKLEREVRDREMDQARAGGGVTGKGRYQVETGPDGNRYITDGTTSPTPVRGGTPQQELARARAVRRAATAPDSPSSRDLAVASEAARIERRAEEKVEQARDDVQEVRELNFAAESESLESAVAREEVAAARRTELREMDERRAARRKLEVAEIEDLTVDNPEVVELKRQAAVTAYLDQL